MIQRETTNSLGPPSRSEGQGLYPGRKPDMLWRVDDVRQLEHVHRYDGRERENWNGYERKGV